MNKKVIRITEIKDFGKNHDAFCDRVLWLRKARRVGDTETVNHTVLGVLRNHPDYVKFEIVETK